MPGHTKRIPDTAQPSLFPNDKPVSEKTPSRLERVEFDFPDPDAIHIGNMPLRDYLEQNDLDWVIRLREMLKASDLSALLSVYEPTGRRPIHPVVMLGLILYGLVRRHWSLRELEALARENVGAWWLCGGLQPDHSTIGNFLNLHADVLTEEYFLSLTGSLVRKLKLPAGAVGGDGTVIQAACSQYRTLRKEAACQAAREARAAAEANPSDAKATKAATRAAEAAAEAEARAEKRRCRGVSTETVCVSPTEPESVMQPLKNGCFRLSYRPSVLATHERLIVGQAVDPSRETASVVSLLSQYEKIFGTRPPCTMLDSNYHTQEILKLFVDQDADLLCPGGTEHAGWSRRGLRGLFGKSLFQYDDKKDVYICPTGKTLRLRKNDTDYAGRPFRTYQCSNFTDCPERPRCTRARDGRTIKRYEGEELKEAMAKVMSNERAQKAYRRRKAWVEPVYSELTDRQGLRRFHRRGLRGVRLEFALHCLAYNLRRAIRLLDSLLRIFLPMLRIRFKYPLRLAAAVSNP